MGIDIDEAWEYFTPDPEIDDIVHGKKAHYLIEEVTDWRLHKYKLSGIRLGKGNPDFYHTHLARDPDKYKYKTLRESLDPRPCKGCGEMFLPDRQGRKHCSSQCYKRKGRERELPESAQCVVCKGFYRPKFSTQKCCSPLCGNKLGSKIRQGSTKVDVDKFKELWEAGTLQTEIMEQLGIIRCTVQRLVKRLGLKPRPVGNHSRKQRKK